MLPSSAFAITNLDDKRGAVMLQNTAAKNIHTACEQWLILKERFSITALSGLVMNVNEQEVHFRLIGEFNAYNLLAVYGAAICLEKKTGCTTMFKQHHRRRRKV